MSLRIGIDIGSTTVKVVVLDEQNKLLFRSYERHCWMNRTSCCSAPMSGTIPRPGNGPARPSIPSPVCWRANR